MLQTNKPTNHETKQPRRQEILVVDFDGTLTPIMQRETNKPNDPCKSLNQWSIVCFLVIQGQKISTKPELDNKAIKDAWGQFQEIFIKWAYNHGREDTNLIPSNYDPQTDTKPHIILAQILEKYSEIYKKWKGQPNEEESNTNNSNTNTQKNEEQQTEQQENYSTVFFNRLQQAFTEEELYAIFDPEHKAQTREELLQQIFTQHIKDVIWLLATFEFWHELGITTKQLEEYGRFIGGLLKPDLLNQIVTILEEGNTVIINTFGVQEVSLTAITFALKQRLIEKGYKPDEAEAQIQHLLASGKLKVTGESYTKYCKLTKQAEDPKQPENAVELEKYLFSKILPLNPNSPMMATSIGKVFRLSTAMSNQQLSSITALGDSRTTDGAMVRYVNRQNILSPFVLHLSEEEQPDNSQNASVTPIPQTKIVEKYTMPLDLEPEANN